MTVAEFEAQRETLRCRHCGRTPLTTRRLANRSLEVVCLCGRWDPIGGAPYLDQKKRPSTRVPLSKPDESLTATWLRWGNRCTGCGTAADVLDQLGIGRQRQHAPPIATVQGDESQTTLLPICALCHEHVTANQRWLQNLVTRLIDRMRVDTQPGDLADQEPA